MSPTLLSFTAHNVLLPDGTKTMPESDTLLSDFVQCKAFLRTLKAFFRDKTPGQIRIADLGCLEGGYAVEMARAGFNVVAFEVRQSNYEKCLYVAEQLKLPNLQFIKNDIRNIESYGLFDAVLCCGLLYHLDNSVAYLNTLSRITRSLLLLNTHFSQENLNPRFPLSELTENEGIPGRWLREFEPEIPVEQMELAHWSAWKNHRSFWPLKAALIETLTISGFPLIFEQVDRDFYLEAGCAEMDRTSLVAIKI
jgi:SAM-dependent methyltransferase